MKLKRGTGQVKHKIYSPEWAKEKKRFFRLVRFLGRKGVAPKEISDVLSKRGYRANYQRVYVVAKELGVLALKPKTKKPVSPEAQREFEKARLAEKPIIEKMREKSLVAGVTKDGVIVPSRIATKIVEARLEEIENTFKKIVRIEQGIDATEKNRLWAESARERITHARTALAKFNQGRAKESDLPSLWLHLSELVKE